MGDTGARLREQINFLAIQLNAMGMPDVITCPAEILGVLTGPAAEFL